MKPSALVDSLLVVCMAKGREDDFTLFPDEKNPWPPSQDQIIQEAKSRRPWVKKIEVYASKSWLISNVKIR